MEFTIKIADSGIVKAPGTIVDKSFVLIDLSLSCRVFGLSSIPFATRSALAYADYNNDANAGIIRRA